MAPVNRPFMSLQVPSARRLQVLDSSAIRRLQAATLAVLEEVGVRFPLRRALEAFADAGAQVDFDAQVVRIPEFLLHQCLAAAPRSIVLGGRGGEAYDLHLDGTRTYFGVEGIATMTVDLDSGTQRPSTKSDVAMMATICDFLDSVALYWPMASARDVPPPVMALHELEAAVVNTAKHVQLVSCVDRRSAAYAVEMAMVLAGDSRSLRQRPPLSMVISPISPLAQEGATLEAALVAAAHGIPLAIAPMPTLGATAPASLAGTLVVGNAEILSAVCLLELLHPGAPVCHCLFSGIMHPYTGSCLAAAPQQPLLANGGVELGRSYGLPVVGGIGGTDDRHPASWRTAKDKTANAVSACLLAPDIVLAFGLLHQYSLLCPEQIMLDQEILLSIRQILGSIPVDDDSLALGEIKEAGPGGHFLHSAYTRRQMRRLWEPGVARQWDPEANDFRDPRLAAQERVRWILANHRVLPLEEAQARELGRILLAAERELTATRKADARLT